MASYKSHLSHPRRTEEQTPYSQRALTSRLPQRSVTPTSAVAAQLATPGQSKLQKRRTTRDEQIQPGRGVTSQRVPVSRPSVTVKSRQGSTTPTVPISHLSPTITGSKSVRQISSSRLPKLEVTGNTRTPSLVSGSSVSTVDSPRSNVLRRKPSNIGVAGGRQDSQTRSGSMSSQEEAQPINTFPGGYKDPFSETVLGISLPPSSAILARSEVEVEIFANGYSDLDVGPTEVLPLPAPQYALSTTPSTHYSESPGPFSVSSTPTSMSSYSPGVALSSKASIRARQTSPLESRPPVTRHRTPDESSVRQQHGLSAVRESSTSSSSTSTILAEGARQKEKQSPARLPAPPPSPPTHTPPMESSYAPSKKDANGLNGSSNGHIHQPNSEQKAHLQAPPELAHLADTTASQLETRRPTRPSRDGTAEIVGLRGPSPIIQSNMTFFPSAHRRTSSTESKTEIAIGSKGRFGKAAKPSSHNPSPNPSLASGFPPVSRVPTRGPTPEAQSDSDKQHRSKTYPTPGPSPSKTSRFGFFSRRTKTEPAPSAAKPDNKLHRRGPIAGTGHEGYGKYSFRGRSGSTVSATSIGRSASAGTTTESLHHTPSSRKSSITSTTSTEMDDFFLERLTPVVIRGTGSSTELSRSPEPMQSASSLDLTSSTADPLTKTTSKTSQPVLEANRPALLPSAMSDSVRGGSSPVKRMPLGMRRPSESDDDTKRSFLPSLATRRTSRASKVMDGAPLSKVSSSGSTGEKSRNGYGSDSKESRWLKSKKADKQVGKPEKSEKPAVKPTRKWNFFQRAHATTRVESPAVEASASARAPPSRSVAHYALMDAQNNIDLEDIEQIMQEANSAPDELSPPEDNAPDAISDDGSDRKERLQSMLLPPKAVFPSHLVPPTRSASPKVFLHPDLQPPQVKLTLDTNVQSSSQPSAPPSQPDLTPVTDLSPSSSPFRPLSPVEVAPSVVFPLAATLVASPPALSPPGPPPTDLPPRPSRLPQVGRIPRVVSRRNQERRPPSQSFSRPFVPDQPRPNLPSRTSFDSVGPLTVTAGPPEPYPVLQGLDALSHGSAIATMSPSAEDSSRQSEFFKFPPRKDSEVSYSSSSGIWSFPPTSGTAVVPRPGAPQSDDEVWREYDDLIDEVLSPIDSILAPLEKGQQDRRLRQHPSLEPLPLKTKTSHVPSQSVSSINAPSNPSLHLRRSRLLAVLHSAQSPTSPVSLSEFLQDYGERNLSVVDPVTGRLSFPLSNRMSTGSVPRTRPGSTRSSLPASLALSARQSRATLTSNSDKDRESGSSNRYRDSRLMEIAETQTDGLVSMANLRFGALMTSKWLSFGRVLFSPVHFDLKDPNEDRVLVIDGLGKDWSYYCALTYPEATIYNLGPGASSSATPNTNEPWSTLSNHRHICHSSLATPFPFPRGFFACAVLRFPPALPSSTHRFIVSECKRVLRPGGYLELSVLDLDLVNMGNRARRAVRGLKVKMQVADEHVSLRNISDEIMAGLGRKGFTECNRCFVGVPVAGKLPTPDDADTSEGKRRKGSNASSITRTNGATSSAKKQPKPEVSFSDLLNTQSPSESTDDGITDMVARVGRWWYSRCYESLVLPEAGEPNAATSGDLLQTSIWRDENLIKECEKRGTSFRLLIGYAQKPEVGVRRTVSV